MRRLLTVSLLIVVLHATAQKDTTKIERLMYHYDSLHKVALDRMVSHKGSLDSDVQLILNAKRYSDSLNKYIDLRLLELDEQLDSLRSSFKKINKRT